MPAVRQPTGRMTERSCKLRKRCDFLGHYKCDKSQTLPGGTTHSDLPVHTTLVTLTTFRSHSGVQQLYLNIFRSYPIKLKLCKIVKYVK